MNKSARTSQINKMSIGAMVEVNSSPAEWSRIIAHAFHCLLNIRPFLSFDRNERAGKSLPRKICTAIGNRGAARNSSAS